MTWRILKKWLVKDSSGKSLGTVFGKNLSEAKKHAGMKFEKFETILPLKN